MKKIALFFIQIIFVIGCNNGCKDENACNDGMDEPCKYSDEQEATLEGEWLLVDIRDINGNYLFSSSDDTDDPLDEEIEFIVLEFDDDNKCTIETGPSDISSNLYESDWTINPCFDRLNFRNIVPVETEINMNPDYWPFGYLKITYLDEDDFYCEDKEGNTLRWERN